MKLKIGDTVKVISECEFKGEIGEIIKTEFSDYKLEGDYLSGCWFHESELQLVKGKDHIASVHKMVKKQTKQVKIDKLNIGEYSGYLGSLKTNFDLRQASPIISDNLDKVLLKMQNKINELIESHNKGGKI